MTVQYRPVIPHTNRRAAAGASRIVATSSGFLRIFFAHAFAPKLASDACRSASGRRSASHPLRSTFCQGYHPTDQPTYYYLIHDRRKGRGRHGLEWAGIVLWQV